MIRKQSAPTPDKVRIVFELPASLWADQVSVVADFNNWDATATPLWQERDGVWRAVVDMPIGRCYAFRYLINGRWSTDAHADGFAPSGYGSDNSIVKTDPPVHRPDPALGAGMIHETPPFPPSGKLPRRPSLPGCRGRKTTRPRRPARIHTNCSQVADLPEETASDLSRNHKGADLQQ